MVSAAPVELGDGVEPDAAELPDAEDAAVVVPELVGLRPCQRVMRPNDNRNGYTYLAEPVGVADPLAVREASCSSSSNEPPLSALGCWACETPLA